MQPVGDGITWRLGTIGFWYPEWAKGLYAGLPRAGKVSGPERLAFYARHFDFVEINTTFYGPPAPATVQAWANATPESFRFSIKMPRDVTHGPTPAGAPASAEGPPAGHLCAPATLAIVRQLLASLEPLGPRLGAVLVQFPPRFEAQRLGEVLALLDAVGGAARLAVEFRHDSWWSERVAAELRGRGVIMVAADDAPARWAAGAPPPAEGGPATPRRVVATGDALYARWLGRHGQFPDRAAEKFDPSARLAWWGQELAGAARQAGARTVYGVFQDDFSGDAVRAAERMRALVGLPVVRGATAAEPKGTDQPTLFG